VRREETGPTGGRLTEQAVSRCKVPAGESPVRVSVGGRGSRPPLGVERPFNEAWCRKPLKKGEQVRGPQHEVKPAASTELQSESRAAHVTAKATSAADLSEWEAAGLSGVWGAAREQGTMRNTRGPSALRREPQGGPYKPKVKSGAAQRESEGAVVPEMAMTKNVAGGKGLCFSHATFAGTSEGMAANSGPNYPYGLRIADKAPQPLRWLREEDKPMAHASPGGLSVSRVRGAACNGIDHAGESPVAAIARFGCVALPDAHGGRPTGAQAQVKVLGAGKTGPTRQEGERTLGPQRERTLQRRNGFPRGAGRGVSSSRAHSRMGEGQWALTKVTGQCSRRLLRRMGGGTWRMVDDSKQGRSRRCEARGTSREARLRVTARLADRVVVAMMPRDSRTLAEQRARGAAMRSMTRRRTRHAFGPTGDPRRVAKASAKGASNSLVRSTGKGAPEVTVRSRCLEAVLGKTRRTEFQRGLRKRSYGRC